MLGCGKQSRQCPPPPPYCARGTHSHSPLLSLALPPQVLVSAPKLRGGDSALVGRLAGLHARTCSVCVAVGLGHRREPGADYGHPLVWKRDADS
jgi:hypothetical protein